MMLQLTNHHKKALRVKRYHYCIHWVISATVHQCYHKRQEFSRCVY